MKMDFIVRQITVADYGAVYNLIKTAFETASHRDGNEQDFAVNLRNGNSYISELDLVAQLDGKLIGHIMLTRTYVTKPDGSIYDTLLVAPLAVLIEYRNLGVGSALMKEGLRIAMAMGYGSAFLIGEPAYYKRFGFQLTSTYGIGHQSMPAEYLMVNELTSGALDGVTGLVNM